MMCLAAGDADLNAMERGRSAERGAGGTCGAAKAPKRATARISAPPDLLAFLRDSSVRHAARALGLSIGTAHRVRSGYWPDDARYLVDAWGAYKAARGQVESAWFIRRVYPGGLVRHAGRQYTAGGLAARCGQHLAVARAGGALIAQTLDLPAERLALLALDL